MYCGTCTWMDGANDSVPAVVWLWSSLPVIVALLRRSMTEYQEALLRVVNSLLIVFHD